MISRLKFYYNRLCEKLWARPLFMCILSLIGAFIAKGVESLPAAKHLPRVSGDSVEALLTILSGSMLVIATFAVGSMVSSLASASSTATPRTFPIVISDDMSQNALSIFIGAFIFSLVSIVLFKNGFYMDAGITALFAFTIITFVVVILTFVRWVDSIARLGRLGATIDKTVKVTNRALQDRRLAPTHCCLAIDSKPRAGCPIHSDSIGYVQRIDVAALQQYAQEHELIISIQAMQGTFATPDRELALVYPEDGDLSAIDTDAIVRSFIIGDRRTFDEDPRFGFVVLAEIAGRALSPAVNDPGTAIDITGAIVRLIDAWSRPVTDDERRPCQHDRLEFPQLKAHDIFDDAFTAIARDGAGSVEVASRLQKALKTLASIDDPEIHAAAIDHSRLALKRAKNEMSLSDDYDIIRDLAKFSSPD